MKTVTDVEEGPCEEVYGCTEGIRGGSEVVYSGRVTSDTTSK